MHFKGILISVLACLVFACAPEPPTPTPRPTVAPTDSPTPLPTPLSFVAPATDTPQPAKTTAASSKATAPRATTAATLPPVRHGTAAKVTRVIDGQTIQVSLSGKTYTVVYIGIDAPSIGSATQPASWMGPESLSANRALVENKVVGLEKDVSETDSAGRLLRYVYVGDLFINAEMLRKGFAQVRLIKPDVKFQLEFYKYQDEARVAGRGIWGKPPVDTGENPAPAGTVAAGGQQLVSVTTPVKRGTQAGISIRTTAGTNCSIAVYYKASSTPAPGLSAVKAGSAGLCAWSWIVPSNAAVGTGKIAITTGTKKVEYAFTVQ